MNQIKWKQLLSDMRKDGHRPFPSEDISRIGERARLAKAISAKQRDGFVGLSVWQMDCDCASWTSFEVLKANTMVVDHYLDDLHANAEGRVSWHFVTPQEARDSVGEHRDHALEAFEDGHPHVVYI